LVETGHLHVTADGIYRLTKQPRKEIPAVEHRGVTFYSQFANSEPLSVGW